MGNLIRTIRGYYRVRIRGAAPELALNRLMKERVAFWDIERPDDFTVDISVRKKDLQRVLELAEKVQHEGEFLREAGVFCHFRGLKRRKLFLVSVAIILAAVFFQQNFVWFLHVEGNETIPEAQILAALKDLGVGFGTWGNSIVPQTLKYKMLNEIPQLEWLTVNRSGGVATVVVRERDTAPKAVDRRSVTNIVADRDCIIDEMQVLSGQAVCKVGQTVLEGQLLVSGYADWGHCIQASRSLAEIYGRSWRRQNAVAPLTYGQKTGFGDTHTRYALQIGRKRINFYTDSGIWGTDCDKIYESIPLALPGGHTFPVALIRETATERTLEERRLDPLMAQQLLEDGTRRAVEADMIAGTIVKPNLQVRQEADVYRLSGSYECRELVGKSVGAIQFEGNRDS